MGWSYGHEIAAEGVKIVDWLMAHPAEQVRILLGNHDICRVMEFAHISDAEFETAYGRSGLRQNRIHGTVSMAPGIRVVAVTFVVFRAQRRQIQRALLSNGARLAYTIETADGHRWLIPCRCNADTDEVTRTR